MSDPSRIPSYRHHEQSGQAVVTLSDGLASRRDVLLGKYGTAASRNVLGPRREQVRTRIGRTTSMSNNAPTARANPRSHLWLITG